MSLSQMISRISQMRKLRLQKVMSSEAESQYSLRVTSPPSFPAIPQFPSAQSSVFMQVSLQDRPKSYSLGLLSCLEEQYWCFPPFNQYLALGVLDNISFPEMCWRSHLHGMPLQTNKQSHLYLFSLFKGFQILETGTAGTLLRKLSVAQAVSAKTCFPLFLISVEDCPPHYAGRTLGVIVYSVQVSPLLKPFSGWITSVPRCVLFPIKILKKREEENHSILGFEDIIELCFVRRFTAKNLFHTVAMEVWETVNLEPSSRN